MGKKKQAKVIERKIKALDAADGMLVRSILHLIQEYDRRMDKALAAEDGTEQARQLFRANMTAKQIGSSRGALGYVRERKGNYERELKHLHGKKYKSVPHVYGERMPVGMSPREAASLSNLLRINDDFEISVHTSRAPYSRDTKKIFIIKGVDNGS